MPSAADQGKQAAAKLINDLQDISFLEIGVIVLGTWLAIYVTRKVLPYLANRGPSQFRLYLLGAVPIIRLALLVLAILWVVPIIFNITLQNFLVVGGAVGVAIGFAFKDYVSSLLAGVVAIFERPYRPGDWVKVGSDYGEVVSVGMRSFQILTASANVITIPHDCIWAQNISNANDGERTLMCIAHFYLAPRHDAARIREVLRDVAMTSAYLSYEEPVQVTLAETPWATHYQLKAYPYELRDQFSFISDMTVRGKRAIVEAGGKEVSASALPGTADGQSATLAGFG